MSDVVLTGARDRVLLITLNRPDAMNAKERPKAFAEKRPPVWSGR